MGQLGLQCLHRVREPTGKEQRWVGVVEEIFARWVLLGKGRQLQSDSVPVVGDDLFPQPGFR